MCEHVSVCVCVCVCVNMYLCVCVNICLCVCVTNLQQLLLVLQQVPQLSDGLLSLLHLCPSSSLLLSHLLLQLLELTASLLKCTEQILMKTVREREREEQAE